jgi:hypothetical protein
MRNTDLDTSVSLPTAFVFRRLQSVSRAIKAGCRFAAPASLALALSFAANAASVKDFGARGDGNTDDTAAIQNAINATTSGTLVFPAGTYRVSNTLYVRGNVTYQGQNNPVLTGTSGGTVMQFPQNGANNITVTGLVFDGGQLRTEGNNEVPKNVHITGNTFRNITVNSNNWTLAAGIFASNGISQSSIDHNTFQNIMINGSTRPDGTINSIDSFATAIYMYGADSTSIVNNTFDTVGEGVKICFTQNYASNNVNIGYNSFNKIHRMGMELQDANGCGHQNTITPTSNLVIEYNDIHLNNDPYWSSFGISVAMPPVASPIVRYNRIIGELPIALNVPGIGIEAGGQNAQTYGNTVEGYYGLAIGIFGGSTNVKYHDNYACSLGQSDMTIGDEHGSTPNEQMYNNTIVPHCPATGIPNPLQPAPTQPPAPPTQPTPPPTTGPIANGAYVLTNQYSKLVMDDPGLSVVSGTQMIQWSANGGDNQKWTFTGDGNGNYTIANVHSGMYLTDAGQGKLQQMPLNNAASQLWTVKATSNGAYTLINKATGKVVDDANMSLGQGNGMITWSANNGQNQNWTLK